MVAVSDQEQRQQSVDGGESFYRVFGACTVS